LGRVQPLGTLGSTRIQPEGINKIKGVKWGQAWWHMHLIPDLRRLRQEDHEFETNLSHILKPCLKKKKKKCVWEG
jgi:hypothetical protein